MSTRTKAGIFFTVLGLVFLGLGGYLLLGTAFAYSGGGIIATGKLYCMAIHEK